MSTTEKIRKPKVAPTAEQLQQRKDLQAKINEEKEKLKAPLAALKELEKHLKALPKPIKEKEKKVKTVPNWIERLASASVKKVNGLEGKEKEKERAEAFAKAKSALEGLLNKKTFSEDDFRKIGEKGLAFMAFLKEPEKKAKAKKPENPIPAQ